MRGMIFFCFFSYEKEKKIEAELKFIEEFII